MKVSSETKFTLELNEQEFEDLYEALEAAQTPADASASSDDFCKRIVKILFELPYPPSRTRDA